MDRMPSQANQPLPDGYVLMNYRIDGVLSRGGFSIVYLAQDENGLPVATSMELPFNFHIRSGAVAVPALPEALARETAVARACGVLK